MDDHSRKDSTNKEKHFEKSVCDLSLTHTGCHNATVMFGASSPWGVIGFALRAATLRQHGHENTETCVSAMYLLGGGPRAEVTTPQCFLAVRGCCRNIQFLDGFGWLLRISGGSPNLVSRRARVWPRPKVFASCFNISSSRRFHCSFVHTLYVCVLLFVYSVSCMV